MKNKNIINAAQISASIQKTISTPKPYKTFFDAKGSYVVCQTREELVEYNTQAREEKLIDVN